MKNKGFTLVELLAVIVVLAIISIITIPMIGNVIDESKKKALEVSANGLLEAASYYTMNHDGVTEFVFDETKKGETIKGEQLEYKGNIEGTGKLYIDQEGDISLCLVDDKYYVYKNYNSGIYVGEVKDNSCIIGYDVLTNKYVAMLDDGSGQISNVYSKDEVNNLIDNVESKVTANTNEITNIKSTIEALQNSLNNYALKSSLNETNTNLNNLSSIVASNTEAINNVNSNLVNLIKQASCSVTSDSNGVVTLNLDGVNMSCKDYTVLSAYWADSNNGGGTCSIYADNYSAGDYLIKCKMGYAGGSAVANKTSNIYFTYIENN